MTTLLTATPADPLSPAIDTLMCQPCKHSTLKFQLRFVNSPAKLRKTHNSASKQKQRVGCPTNLRVVLEL